MKIYSRVLRTILILVIVVWSYACSRQEEPAAPIRQPDVAIYRFHTFDNAAGLTARHFTFAHTVSGFTLTRPDGRGIVSDIYYVKTFGGMAPTIEIHVLDDRYIVYPETIKDSNVPGLPENPMDAVTHIYDLATGKTIWTSEKYRYDHDVPLRYDRMQVPRLTAKTKKEKAEPDAAGQPATRPELKPDGNQKPQPKSEGRSR